MTKCDVIVKLEFAIKSVAEVQHDERFHGAVYALEDLKNMKASLAHGITSDTILLSKGLGHMVVDSWPLTSAVSEAVLIANSAYMDFASND